MNVDNALSRLLRIDWKGSIDEPTRTTIKLMKEYFRRMAFWAEKLDVADKWPFFDVAEQINPSVRADEAVNRLNEYLSSSPYIHPLVGKVAVWYLHWVCLETCNDFRRFDLPAPYEPLIVMFEQGCLFSTEHGFVDVGGGAFFIGQRANYVEHEPYIDLNDSFPIEPDESKL